jgi:hypothetical protein
MIDDENEDLPDLKLKTSNSSSTGNLSRAKSIENKISFAT